MNSLQFLIPTHGRFKALETTLAAIASTQWHRNTRVGVTVSNNNKGNPDLASKVANLVTGNGFDLLEPNSQLTGNEHLMYLLTHAPLDADWYWIFGDDDSPTQECTEQLAQAMQQCDIDYIHATDEKISPFGNNIIAPLGALAVSYGVLELFSFWSSQIISRDYLIGVKKFIADSNSLLPTDQSDPSTYFLLSLILLETGLRRHGLLLNKKAVSASHTPEELSHGDITYWFRVHMHFRRLVDRGLLPNKLPSDAFNHHYCPIWVKQSLWVLAPVLNDRDLKISPLFSEILSVFDLVDPSMQSLSDKSMIETIREVVKLLEIEADPSRRLQLKAVLIPIYSNFLKIYNKNFKQSLFPC
jgi:hypothetical protein